MVTLGETVQDESACDKSHQRKKGDNPEGSTLSVLAEKEPGELQKTQDPKAELSKLDGNTEGNAVSVKTEKHLGSVQQIEKCNSTGTDQKFQEGSSAPVKPRVSHNLKEKRYLDSASGDHACKDDPEGTSLSTVADESLYNFQQRQSSDTGHHTLQSDQEGSNLSVVPEKVEDSLQCTQNLEVRLIQRDQEGRIPSRIPDKPSEDGYNWRKYGQKSVKCNEFTRSYYRCTHPNCPAKRQVERSHDGHITDIVYLGKHEHPKPQPSAQVAIGVAQPIQSIQLDKPSTSIGEDKSSSPHGPTSCHPERTENSQLPRVEPTDDAVECEISRSSRIRDEVENTGDFDSKRQKRDKCNINEIPVEKPNGERKVVVQTTSLVDIVNDGYRWRKYGQKLVKGNPNPRSYYRCSNVGCPVKKHVERSSDDPKMVITTYEGEHVHDLPPTRTVTPNTAGSSASVDAHDGESKPKSEDNNAVSLDMVVHVSSS